MESFLVFSGFSVNDDADEVDCDGGRDKASASSRSEFESVQVA